ncbi:hypothetical protein E2C01_007732 [Portunus trituberculatus]|uniref:Uncharacterized protein n=1 Tax=Portunus trituberculatus TaxID=210409 RepID=A0A5B7CYY3_PORTR|nr:hypothetical protein [Portunus trituberculatus]
MGFGGLCPLYSVAGPSDGRWGPQMSCGITHVNTLKQHLLTSRHKTIFSKLSRLTLITGQLLTSYRKLSEAVKDVFMIIVEVLQDCYNIYIKKKCEC